MHKTRANNKTQLSKQNVFPQPDNWKMSKSYNSKHRLNIKQLHTTGATKCKQLQNHTLGAYGSNGKHGA